MAVKIKFWLFFAIFKAIEVVRIKQESFVGSIIIFWELRIKKKYIFIKNLARMQTKKWSRATELI